MRILNDLENSFEQRLPKRTALMLAANIAILRTSLFLVDFNPRTLNT